MSQKTADPAEFLASVKSMRDDKHFFTPEEGAEGRPPERKSRLRAASRLVLAVCGLLSIVLVRTGLSAEDTTPASAAPVASSKSPDSSQVISQEIARMFQAWTSEPKPWTHYAGDAACLPCHQDKVNSYHRTAHYFTSTLPTKDTIDGSFRAGSNLLITGNTNLFFRMDADGKGFFQTAVLRISPTEVTQYMARFDVVFGSGRKAQTYLYWREGRLFELPVSYWVGRGTWMNSPSLQLYADGTANFGRGITPRCLECHTTSFTWLNPFEPPDHGSIPFNRYTNLVLGITCEKCHGPGGEHIALFRSPSPPKSPAAMAIVNPARLSRDRQMDTCGLCHAGAGNERTPALSFQPGDVLSKDLEVQTPGPDTPVDVHGNQVQGLERSRCFRSSAAMTCTTCHDVHTTQRDTKSFASHCLKCHSVDRCGMFATLKHVIDDRCVECHMPVQETHAVRALTKGQDFRPEFRNHQIAVYPDVKLR